MKILNYSICVIFFVSIISRKEIMAQFTVSSELRQRGECRYGYAELPVSVSEPAFFVSQRSRIILKYRQPKYSMCLSAQDVRVWGDESWYSSTGIKGDNAALDLHEAWIMLNIGRHSGIKAGRQVLKYDDERLLASRNWGQSGLSYDALLYSYQKNNMQADVVLSLNNDKENIFGNDYPLGKIKTLDLFYLKRKFAGCLDVSCMALATGRQKENTTSTIYIKGTYGIYSNYKKANTGASCSFYYQNGRNHYGSEVSAYFYSVSLSQKIPLIELSLGVDHISGQDMTVTDTVYPETDHLFDIFYGARHRYYGNMDYFSDVPVSTCFAGLVDLYVKLGRSLDKYGTPGMDIHYFLSQQTVHNPAYPDDPAAGLERSLGMEYDISYSYRINKDIDIKAGYSLFTPFTSFKIMQTGTDHTNKGHWGWVMLTVAPEIIKKE